MENSVSFGYAELMELELVAGRLLSRQYASDSTAVVINQTAARTLGYSVEEMKSFIDKDRDGTIRRECPSSEW